MRPVRLFVSSVAVLALTACGGGGSGEGEATGEGGATIQATDGVVALEGTDSLGYNATEVTADTGELTIELTCGEAVEHNVVIESIGEKVAECEPGATGSGSVSLEPGSYTYFCDVPAHRSAGMEGILIVS